MPRQRSNVGLAQIASTPQHCHLTITSGMNQLRSYQLFQVMRNGGLRDRKLLNQILARQFLGRRDRFQDRETLRIGHGFGDASGLLGRQFDQRSAHPCNLARSGSNYLHRNRPTWKTNGWDNGVNSLPVWAYWLPDKAYWAKIRPWKTTNPKSTRKVQTRFF